MSLIQRPHLVILHVFDLERACHWYALLFGVEPTQVAPDYRVRWVGGMEVCFHPADRKVSSGHAGSVVYWETANLQQAKSHAEKLGAKLYRGPLEVEEGRFICQMEDPFDNLFGSIGS
jgi:predicted enzyme related to lactoylglutathione lyase